MRPFGRILVTDRGSLLDMAMGNLRKAHDALLLYHRGQTGPPALRRAARRRLRDARELLQEAER